MADIAVVWDQGCGSLQLNGADLLTDNSLLTAVIISLFTDRRALDSDEIPDGTRDRRGWWGDSFRERPVGSRLWLLSRERRCPPWSAVHRPMLMKRWRGCIKAVLPHPWYVMPCVWGMLAFRFP